MNRVRLFQVIAAHAERIGAPVSLDSLCQAAVVHLGVAALAISVPDFMTATQTVAAQGPLARLLEEMQITLGQGPSLDGIRSSVGVLVPDLDAPDAEARWPLFAPAAVLAGLKSLHVLPMRLGAARFGILVFYLDRVGGLSPAEMADARVFAGIALDLLLEEPGLLSAHSNNLDPDGDPRRDRHFFDDRPEIHQATGMVSVQLGVDLAVALLRLRARAYAENQLLSELARDVVTRKVKFVD